MLKSLKRRMLKIYMNNQLKNEKTFSNGNCQLKYLFMHNKNSDKLLIVFSGFPLKGKKPSYNYVLKFKEMNCSKLYILDDFGNDTRGSYYLGENQNFFIEQTVFQLIEEIRNSIKVEKQKVITVGSSKGGYAALYFAFKYEYGTAISGAPQYLLGDYLAIPGHTEIMQYISGGKSDNDITFLNNVLASEIEQSQRKTKVFIHVSKNEHHYEDHVLPLAEHLDKFSVSYELDLGQYSDHGEVGVYFPQYAKKIINTL